MFFRLNFQLQAMVLSVVLGALLVLGVSLRITQNIQYRTTQLSLLAELGSVIKEWETELGIGARSRIKYASLRREIFLSNYLSSLERIKVLQSRIGRLQYNFGKSTQVSIDSLNSVQNAYFSQVPGLSNPRLTLEMMNQLSLQMEASEEKIKESLENFTQIEVGRIRQENIAGMDHTLNSSRKLVLVSMISVLVVMVFLWLLLKRNMLAPLKVLEKGAKRIGEGGLGLQIDLKVKNELGDFVEVLNRMSTQLKKNQDMEVKLQKLETISQVAISVNHEINNPLMIIMGHAEILKKLIPPENEKIEKKLNSIISECHRISEVTKKLKEIKNPIIEKYVSEDTTMIDLKRSS